MDGIEKTPNMAILKGRLFSGGPFVFLHSSPAWSQTEIFVSSLYPGKGGGFFIPSTSVLGFPGPEKTQIFSFDKNYLSRPVILWASSEMKAGGPFYFLSLLLPWYQPKRKTPPEIITMDITGGALLQIDKRCLVG